MDCSQEARPALGGCLIGSSKELLTSGVEGDRKQPKAHPMKTRVEVRQFQAQMAEVRQ